tara:strand:- start:349 stop:714 length:366 start_codon:yes stop_codon:yes gene_type:complete
MATDRGDPLVRSQIQGDAYSHIGLNDGDVVEIYRADDYEPRDQSDIEKLLDIVGRRNKYEDKKEQYQMFIDLIYGLEQARDLVFENLVTSLQAKGKLEVVKAEEVQREPEGHTDEGKTEAT